MNDTTRTVFIALGVALLVLVLGPALFMGGMMASMMGGMMGGLNAVVPWVLGGLVLIVAVLLLAAGLRRPGAPGGQS